MEKQFLNYKQALTLKELGFDEFCFISVDINGENALFNDDHTLGKNSEIEHGIYLPLWQQAFDFIREKYNLVGTIYANASGYLFEIHKSAKFGGSHIYDSGFSGTNDSGCWDDYNIAREELVNKLIELCKKNL